MSPKQIPKGFYFDQDTHMYYLDGKRLSGTTTVLNVVAKPKLVPWAVGVAIDHIKVALKDGVPITKEVLDEASKAHAKKKDTAAEAGTDVHAQIEVLVKEAILTNSGFLKPFDGINRQVQDFVEWAVSRNVKFLESEKIIYSRKMWLGGTCDIVMEIEGKVYVGDIKTSKEIYPTHWFQVAAYQMCLQEMGLYPNIAGHIIIKTSDRTGFEVCENYDFKGNSTAFRACLFLYRQLESLKYS